MKFGTKCCNPYEILESGVGNQVGLLANRNLIVVHGTNATWKGTNPGNGARCEEYAFGCGITCFP